MPRAFVVAGLPGAGGGLYLTGGIGGAFCATTKIPKPLQVGFESTIAGFGIVHRGGTRTDTMPSSHSLSNFFVSNTLHFFGCLSTAVGDGGWR